MDNLKLCGAFIDCEQSQDIVIIIIQYKYIRTYNKLNLPLSSTALSLALPFPSLPHAFATVGQPLLWEGKKVEGEVTTMVGIIILSEYKRVGWYTILLPQSALKHYTIHQVVFKFKTSDLHEWHHVFNWGE